ncbi:MAG TPA: ATP-binding protein [Bryobacteraceae bacterium]|nr:ATP-binding protein [Bryobacteraceae bacterium]
MSPNSISTRLPPRSPSDQRWLWGSYALAPLLTAVAILARVAIPHGDGHILLIMLLPVLIAAYRGGLGPGIFCTALSAGASAYFLLKPLDSFLIADLLTRLDWFVLIAAGLLVSLLAETTLRERRRAQAYNSLLLDRMLMLDQTYGGLFVWQWNGPITLWNSTAEKLYGFSAEEALGRISHDLLKTTTPSGMDNLLPDLEKNGVWEGELSQSTRDLRRLTVKSRMLLVHQPGLSFVVEANQDVTDTRAAELGLARSQQRFETAFRLSPLGKLVVRLEDDRIIEVNDSYSKLIGAERSEIAGKTLSEHNPLLDGQVLFEVRNRLGSGHAVTGVDVRFQRKNGQIGTGVLYAEELQGAPDRHALLVLHDVTTRQRAEDKLRLANHDLQQFAYAAAHDLQEPTRNIATVLGLLNRTYGGTLDAEGLQLIEESIEAAKRMGQMIRDLLAFTRADPEASLPDSRADANEILNQATGHLKTLIDESGAEIIASDLPILQVQPTHLLQLLQNLIGNALKYRSPETRPLIRITAHPDGLAWKFSVADNGIGFDPVFVDQIFGVFKRLNHSPEFSGNGIGLAICERIVRLYGGKIWAESEPGRGSTFFFTLPAVEIGAQDPYKAMQTSV